MRVQKEHRLLRTPKEETEMIYSKCMEDMAEMERCDDVKCRTAEGKTTECDNGTRNDLEWMRDNDTKRNGVDER